MHFQFSSPETDTGTDVLSKLCQIYEQKLTKIKDIKTRSPTLKPENNIKFKDLKLNLRACINDALRCDSH